MRQIRFYLPLSLSVQQHYAMPEDVARHMSRVLRLEENDKVILFNGDGYEYTANLSEVSKRDVRVLIESKIAVNRESHLKVHLIQALSKGDKMETTIQKVVELGVDCITPVKTERSNIHLSAERLEKKMSHWQAVIHSSCEQTGRNALPKLNSLTTIFSILDDQRKNSGLKLILSPNATIGLSDIANPVDNVTYLIGPEGGLSDAEIRLATECGFVDINVGPRILRTETAGPVLLSMIQMRWGDMR